MMEFRAEAVESLLAVKIVPPQNFDSAKLAAGIGQVAVDAYHQELNTALQMGRKIYPDGMKYYFSLVEKALAELDKAASSPKIAELQTALTDLAESAVLEEPDPLQAADPLRHEKLFDKIVKSGAKLESLVTGKPESEILPKRGPLGGNAQAAGGYGGGGGYGRSSGGYGRGSMDRSSGRPGSGGRQGYGSGR